MKYLTMGLMLFVLVTWVWSGTLKDNFDDDNADEWRLFKGNTGRGLLDETAQWTVKNGELVATSKDICTWASIFGIGNRKWKKYDFECRFKIVKSTVGVCGWVPLVGFGVHFDDTKFINGLDLIILTRGGNTWNLHDCERFLNGNLDNPGRVGNVTIKEGEWYTAEIIFDDGFYKMSIDNQLLCNIPANAPDAGAVAFLARDCEVHFDDIAITGDGIPDRNLGLFIDPKAKLATTWAKIKQEK